MYLYIYTLYTIHLYLHVLLMLIICKPLVKLCLSPAPWDQTLQTRVALRPDSSAATHKGSPSPCATHHLGLGQTKTQTLTSPSSHMLRAETRRNRTFFGFRNRILPTLGSLVLELFLWVATLHIWLDSTVHSADGADVGEGWIEFYQVWRQQLISITLRMFTEAEHPRV